jgi:hypothetical protein
LFNGFETGLTIKVEPVFFSAIIFYHARVSSCAFFIQDGGTMEVKKNFFTLFFITAAMFLLNACNLGVAKPDLNLTPNIPSIETSVMLTVTAFYESMPTSTLTPLPSATFTPSPTTTLFAVPTPTPTQQWLACPGIVATVTDTKKGDMLHILRCEDGFEYDLGPLAKGVYAVGPNDKFLVYVTIDGFIYAARIGDPYMHNLYNLKNEHIYSVFNKRVTPDFKISFAGESPLLKLVLLERNYDQKRVYELPGGITH